MLECLLLVCIYTRPNAKFIVICKPRNDGRWRLSSIQRTKKTKQNKTKQNKQTKKKKKKKHCFLAAAILLFIGKIIISEALCLNVTSDALNNCSFWYNKESHQRKAFTEWPIRLALSDISMVTDLQSIPQQHGTNETRNTFLTNFKH